MSCAGSLNMAVSRQWQLSKVCTSETSYNGSQRQCVLCRQCFDNGSKVSLAKVSLATSETMCLVQ